MAAFVPLCNSTQRYLVTATFVLPLIDICILTPGKAKLKRTSRDVEDNKFLVCAVEAKAGYLVTTDNDLLDMKESEGTQILPPHIFVELLEKDKF